MHKPEFPYLGNQVIISSGRVTAHSKDDMIFLFGKKGIGLSTPATLNLDVGEGIVIASPYIQLGYQATEPVLLGRSTVKQFSDLLDTLERLSDTLAKISWVPGKMAGNATLIQAASTVLKGQIETTRNQLNSSCLSKSTFTN